MVGVLILAGGKGTRLQSVVRDRPKPMADVNGRPFLDYIIEKINKELPDLDIMISVGYMKNIIKDYYKHQYQYVEEDSPLGTGGAIKKAFSESNYEYLIVINGDTMSNYPFKDDIDEKNIIMNAVYMKNGDRYGKISYENDKINFVNKGSGSGYINSGVYTLHRNMLKDEEDSFSFETFLENNLSNIKVNFYNNIDFIDIGVPEDYNKAKQKFGVI